jgi:hypothetical protein
VAVLGRVHPAVIDCADLDEAVEVAALHLYAARGSVEVRPVWSG